MMNFRNIIIFFLLLIGFGCSDSELDEQIIIDENANYRIIFETNWTIDSHPVSYPSNAHFSWMVGVTHGKLNLLFENKAIASNGIEVMAETGKTEELVAEIQDAINMNEAFDVTVGKVIGGNDVDEVILKATIEHPMFSFVSMIAPSPDWFVSNQNIELIKNGDWVESLEFDVVLYDAGTDSGMEFTSMDLDTNPKEVIKFLINPPLGNGVDVSPPVGTIRIIKQ